MNRTTIITAAALTLVAAGLLFAGPLNPPAGPVTSTYKTLTEVEPRTAINLTNTPGDADSLFKITQPGSYYLTGNITGVVGKHGIEIAASGVTLDLMGFDLSGLAASLDGVSATIFNLTNITICNGSVRGWGDEGVDLGSNFADNSTVIDVRASGNAGSGITVGTGGMITGCSAAFNGGTGISTTSGGTITRCSAAGNTSNGIAAASGSTITGCSAYDNTANGISTGGGSTITGCAAYINTGNGIFAGGASTITGCLANRNSGNGIAVTTNCLVLANTCQANGNIGDGAGIHATGGDNRIESNNCADNDRGIDVDAAGNIIIKNTCSGNTSNWEIAVGNVCLVILATPIVAAISGDSGGLSPGSTNPNANFTY